jgi:glutamyl-tRNA synthetase
LNERKKTMTVKVRFAPSPTGFLHVGNIRTALVNWLYARQCGGQFILRLDDTDIERSTEAFAAAIQADLKWLGLEWDDFFRQSDRIDRYDLATKKLKDSARLYPCYETEDELELKRRLQLARHKPPVYDREGLSLTPEQKAAYEEEGRKPHWRFALEVPARVEWNDMVRGHTGVDMASLSDPVLVRADGSYLYTLPSVVDDIEYGITHIMRGEDHVTNSAVQIQLFEALGAPVPALAHFSLLTGAEGEGLSKRLGAEAIQDFREKEGLEPMAINSLLARLGTSDPVEPYVSFDDLVSGFDASHFGRAAARFDPAELKNLNAKILHALPFASVQSRFAGLGLEGVDDAFWNAVRGNLQVFADVKNWWQIVHGRLNPVIADKYFLEAASALLPPEPWDEGSWKSWTEAVKAQTGAKGKALFMPLRQALTGLEHGPEMSHLLPLIGPARVRSRLSGHPA